MVHIGNEDSDGLFSKMGHLMSRKQNSHVVDLYDADLDKFEKSFNSNLRLKKKQRNSQVLDLSMCELRRIYKATVKANMKIQVLKINCNYLTTLPQQLEYIKNLKEVHAQQNNFRYFPAPICNLTNLKVLNISYNQLKSISDSIGELIHLTDLDLSYNKIFTLPNSFENLRNLSNLNMEKNQLEEVPLSIFECSSLIKLNLSSNSITYLPKSFIKLSSLNELDLHDNNVLWMDEDLTKKVFEKLIKLRLSYNSYDNIVTKQINNQRNESKKIKSTQSKLKSIQNITDIRREYSSKNYNSKKLKRQNLVSPRNRVERLEKNKQMRKHAPDNQTLKLPSVPNQTSMKRNVSKATDSKEKQEGQNVKDEPTVLKFHSYAFAHEKETSL